MIWPSRCSFSRCSTHPACTRPAGRTLRSARGTAGARALVTHSDVIQWPESHPRYPASRPLSHSVHWKVLPRRLLRAAITIPLVLPPLSAALRCFSCWDGEASSGNGSRRSASLFLSPPVRRVLAQPTRCSSSSPSKARCGSADRRSELAAASLGASPWQIFRP